MINSDIWVVDSGWYFAFLSLSLLQHFNIWCLNHPQQGIFSTQERWSQSEQLKRPAQKFMRSSGWIWVQLLKGNISNIHVLCRATRLLHYSNHTSLVVAVKSLLSIWMCLCMSEWGEGAPAAGDAGDGRAEIGSDHEEGWDTARGGSWAGAESCSALQGDTHKQAAVESILKKINVSQR